MGPRARRTPLSRDRVLQVAVDLADRDGLAALSMRALAAEVCVEAMSLDHHVAGKEAVLDGMLDLVFAEIYPAPGGPQLGRRAAGSRTRTSTASCCRSCACPSRPARTCRPSPVASSATFRPTRCRTWCLQRRLAAE